MNFYCIAGRVINLDLVDSIEFDDSGGTPKLKFFRKEFCIGTSLFESRKTRADFVNKILKGKHDGYLWIA